MKKEGEYTGEFVVLLRGIDGGVVMINRELISNVSVSVESFVDSWNKLNIIY